MRKKKKENQILNNVNIIDAASDGNAVGKAEDNMIVFVPYAAPGDVVDVMVTHKKKSFKHGKIINFHKYSDSRIEPFCEHFGLCGGCKWQHMTYESQLQFKHKQVIDALTRIGGVSPTSISPIMGADQTRYYRNKLEFTFSNFRWMTDNEYQDDEDRNLNGLGFHLPGMFNRVININHCYLQKDPSNQIRNFVKDYADKHGLEYYNIKTHEGLLRNLVVRMSNTGGLMVILVVAEDNAENKYFPLLDAIANMFPEITSLMYIINTKFNDDYSDLDVFLYKGDDHLIEQMDDLKFIVGPKSFYQTNHEQAYRLYKKTLEYAGLEGGEVVYDLYTGTGTIANFVAVKAKKVVGIEYVEQSVLNARENSKFNNLTNTEFESGDMAKILTDEFIEHHGIPDVVITDPPRAGMHPDVVNRLLKYTPARIVYVSCNPATQARDISMLTEKYDVLKVQPVDMFPHTKHVENIVLLEHKAN